MVIDWSMRLWMVAIVVAMAMMVGMDECVAAKLGDGVTLLEANEMDRWMALNVGEMFQMAGLEAVVFTVSRVDDVGGRRWSRSGGAGDLVWQHEGSLVIHAAAIEATVPEPVAVVAVNSEAIHGRVSWLDGAVAEVTTARGLVWIDPKAAAAHEAGLMQGREQGLAPRTLPNGICPGPLASAEEPALIDVLVAVTVTVPASSAVTLVKVTLVPDSVTLLMACTSVATMAPLEETSMFPSTVSTSVKVSPPISLMKMPPALTVTCATKSPTLMSKGPLPPDCPMSP